MRNALLLVGIASLSACSGNPTPPPVSEDEVEEVAPEFGRVGGCVGDYVYKPNEYEVGFGIRIRKDPDYLEMTFLDYSGFEPEYVSFVDNTVFFAETGIQPLWVFNCNEEPFLRFPDNRPKTVFRVREAEGSVWEVAEAEDWGGIGD